MQCRVNFCKTSQIADQVGFKAFTVDPQNVRTFKFVLSYMPFYVSALYA